MEFTITIIALVISILTLCIALYRQFRLEKRLYALEMIREWNKQTAKDKILIEKAIPGIYEKCNERCLSFEAITKIYNAAYAPKKHLNTSKTNTLDIDYLLVKESIIRLLNYFEFISSAYLNNAVDKKVIQNSFSGTMVRYYCVLYKYIETEREKTNRNPWQPFEEFVRTVTKPNYKYPLLNPCLLLNNSDELVCSKNPKIKLN